MQLLKYFNHSLDVDDWVFNFITLHYVSWGWSKGMLIHFDFNNEIKSALNQIVDPSLVSIYYVQLKTFLRWSQDYGNDKITLANVDIPF